MGAAMNTTDYDLPQAKKLIAKLASDDLDIAGFLAAMDRLNLPADFKEAMHEFFETPDEEDFLD